MSDNASDFWTRSNSIVAPSCIHRIGSSARQINGSARAEARGDDPLSILKPPDATRTMCEPLQQGSAIRDVSEHEGDRLRFISDSPAHHLSSMKLSVLQRSLSFAHLLSNRQAQLHRPVLLENLCDCKFRCNDWIPM